LRRAKNISLPSEVCLTDPPSLVSISPIEMQGASRVRIIQVIAMMCHQPIGDSPAIKEFVVFEYCPDIYNVRWRVCARVHESTRYFKE
jgi:hypothetical protein